MLKDSFAQIGAFETLRKVSDIGYHAVEVSQIPMDKENISQLQQAREELGMNIAALSVAVESAPGLTVDALDTSFEKIVDDAKSLGTDLLRIGMLPIPSLGSLDKVLDFAKRAEDYALRLKEEGLRLYYHNHHLEFSKFDGRHLLDLIVEASPTMGLEIDVHWVQRGGLDPVRTLQKYAGNTAMVHLKDYRIGTLAPDSFDKLSSGDFPGFMNDFRNVVEFAEVGEGNLDFAEIVPAAIAGGAEYLLVEQDELYGRTVWDALATSHANLNALGFGELLEAETPSTLTA